MNQNFRSSSMNGHIHRDLHGTALIAQPKWGSAKIVLWKQIKINVATDRNNILKQQIDPTKLQEHLDLCFNIHQFI